MRNLEREIGNVCRKVARKVVGDDKHTEAVTPESLSTLLGVAKYRDSQVQEKSEIGLVTGLAWTEMGGSILQTEVQVLDGKGKMTATGQLGDVMQESAQAALTYIRSRSHHLGLPRDFYRNVDIHVHVPEGAIPKDGPSAGITLATALASALTKIEVRRDIAMTGEITLRGKVLPIGGLKEKLLAAHRAGIREAILPAENKRDLADLPDLIKNEMKLNWVEQMDEVLEIALVSRPLEAGGRDACGAGSDGSVADPSTEANGEHRAPIASRQFNKKKAEPTQVRLFLFDGIRTQVRVRPHAVRRIRSA